MIWASGLGSSGLEIGDVVAVSVGEADAEMGGSGSCELLFFRLFLDLLLPMAPLDDGLIGRQGDRKHGSFVGVAANFNVAVVLR